MDVAGRVGRGLGQTDQFSRRSDRDSRGRGVTKGLNLETKDHRRTTRTTAAAASRNFGSGSIREGEHKDRFDEEPLFSPQGGASAAGVGRDLRQAGQFSHKRDDSDFSEEDEGFPCAAWEGDGSMAGSFRGQASSSHRFGKMSQYHDYDKRETLLQRLKEGKVLGNKSWLAAATILAILVSYPLVIKPLHQVSKEMLSKMRDKPKAVAT